MPHNCKHVSFLINYYVKVSVISKKCEVKHEHLIWDQGSISYLCVRESKKCEVKHGIWFETWLCHICVWERETPRVAYFKPMMNMCIKVDIESWLYSSLG